MKNAFVPQTDIWRSEAKWRGRDILRHCRGFHGLTSLSMREHACSKDDNADLETPKPTRRRLAQIAREIWRRLATWTARLYSLTLKRSNTVGII